MNISFRRSILVASFTASLLLWARGVNLNMQAAQDSGASAAPAGNVEKGKQLFATTGCYGCHGDEAQGAMGPQLAATSKSFPEFLATVRKPKGAMPPFDTATLTDAQVGDIYAFVKSLGSASGSTTSKASSSGPDTTPQPTASGAAPGSAEDTFKPAGSGNAQHGKALFISDGCYQCHGLVGQGAAQTGAPRIGPPPIPIPAFAAYIRHPAGNMPPYAAKVVPDSDVTDIYAFLQSIKAPAPAKDIPLLNQ